MPLNSQTYKQEIYPSHFTHDEKLYFDELLAQCEIIHKKEFIKDPWLIKYAIICYINGINGRTIDIDKQEVEKIKKVYEVKSRVFETPESDDYKDPEKFLINLSDEELNQKLNIITSNIVEEDE